MTDYKAGHLAWIQTTKSFTPKYARDYRADISYYEIMKMTYNNKGCTQEHAKSFFIADKLWHKQTFCLSKEIDKEIEKLEPTPNGLWFVTMGFNHQTWNVKHCCEVIQNILNMDWVISGKANFELYRTNGEHPHVHFIFETKHGKGTILDKLFRPLYVKKVVLARNFIDIKPMRKHHHDYINLIKEEEKMKCVAKDIIWRNENKIPDYEKKWKNDYIKELLNN